MALAQSIATAAQATGVVSASVSLGVQILLGGSLVLFWSLVNTIQIVSLVALLNLNMTPGLISLFYILNDFNLQIFNILEEFLESVSKYPSEPYNDKYEKSGFESLNMLVNIPDIILVFFSGLLLFILR